MRRKVFPIDDDKQGEEEEMIIVVVHIPVEVELHILNKELGFSFLHPHTPACKRGRLTCARTYIRVKSVFHVTMLITTKLFTVHFYGI